MESEYWRDRYFEAVRQVKMLRTENQALNTQLDKANQQLAALSAHAEVPTLPETATYEAMKALCGLNTSVHQVIEQVSLLKRGDGGRSLRPKYSRGRHALDERMFENFFILGSTDDQSDPAILFSFPEQCDFNTAVLADFAFPTRFRRQVINMSASGSDYLSLLYPHHERDHKSFIFTVKAGGNSKPSSLDLPNKDKEVLYCCCTVVDELKSTEDPLTVVAEPKCFCVVSYFPCFELHFQVLYTLLSIVRVKRMSDILPQDTMVMPPIRHTVTEWCKEPELLDEQLGLLSQYYESFLLTSSHATINLQSVTSINVSLPRLDMLDCEWVCPVLFSLLSEDDLFKVLCAAMHEKSVVFISKNLNHLTSCVLSLSALMRPFKWVHLLCPILPESLKEVLQAPIPMLAGVVLSPPSLRSYPHIVWVNLDAEDVRQRVVMTQPKQIEMHGLKQQLSQVYPVFQAKPFNDPETLEATQAAIQLFRNYWDRILSLVTASTENTLEGIKQTVLNSADRTDVPFIANLLRTDLFTNVVQGLLLQDTSKL